MARHSQKVTVNSTVADLLDRLNSEIPKLEGWTVDIDDQSEDRFMAYAPLRSSKFDYSGNGNERVTAEITEDQAHACDVNVTSASTVLFEFINMQNKNNVELVAGLLMAQNSGEISRAVRVYRRRLTVLRITNVLIPIMAGITLYVLIMYGKTRI